MRLRHLSEAKGTAEFTYDAISEEMWNDKLKEAQDEAKIYFATENDEAITNRVIIIPQTQWEHSKCKFKCEIRSAGGDWEHEAFYFRCQLIDGYAGDSMTQYSHSHFCAIPGKSDGNLHLVKSDKKGWYHTPDHNEVKEVEEKSERKSWEFLKKHLKDLVDQAIKSRTS